MTIMSGQFIHQTKDAGEETAVSVNVFREAMSRLSAPVVLVTTDGPLGRHGLTVSAICSVSADPPTILVCLNRHNRSHAAFVRNGVVGISVMEPQHESLALRFSSSALGQNEKFDGEHWCAEPGQAPVLAEASVALTGRIVDNHAVGSHDILICQIQAIKLSTSEAAGLVWFDRGFHHMRSLKEPRDDVA